MPVKSVTPPIGDLDSLLQWVRSIGGLAEVMGDGTVSLSLKATAATDKELAAISKFPSVVRLDLSATEISDLGLRDLSSLPKLRSLNLANTRVTDSGLVHLGKLDTLLELVLDQALIEGIGLPSLNALSNLRRLSLVGDGGRRLQFDLARELDSTRSAGLGLHSGQRLRGSNSCRARESVRTRADGNARWRRRHRVDLVSEAASAAFARLYERDQRRDRPFGRASRACGPRLGEHPC